MQDRPGATRTALQTLAIASLAVLVLVTDGSWRWLATAALLVAIAELGPSLGEHVRASALSQRVLVRIRTHAPLVVLVVIATILLWPLVCGEPPASRDHAIHYFQARILVDEMLPSGRLSGWTDRLNHGFPYGEGYPTLGYLWVSAAHLLSFGAIDLRTSYAWGLLGVWVLSLWGMWRLAVPIALDVLARWRGDDEPDATHHHIAAWAGCAAALAWLLDPGAARQGGWNYLMFHGVWPQLLSVALWIAGLVAIEHALRRASPRRIAIAAIAVAGGLLAHPFGLLTTAGSALALVVVLALADDARRREPGGIRVVLSIHALALALAFAGLATFLAAAGEMGRSPVAWSELGELAAKLAIGELFAGPWAWASACAVVGLGLALWSARSFAWVCATTTLGMLVLASQDAITVLRLDLLTAAFKNLQFPRFAIALKPFVFAFAGVAAVLLVAAAWQTLRARAAPPSRTRRLFIAIVIAPVLAAVLGRLDVLAPRPIGAIDTLAGSGHAEHEAALRDALVEEVAQGPVKVAFLRTGMGGATYPLFAIADAGGAAVLDGHVPTVNFVYNVERRTTPVLRRLGVTHVLHDRPLDHDAALASALVELGSFGPFTLHRLALDPEGGPRFARGNGSIVELESAPQFLALDVQTEGGVVSLPRAPSERWQWSLDGEDLEASIATVSGGGIDLLAVELPHGGRVELRWRTTAGERASGWVSGIAALLCLVALALPRPLRLVARLHDRRTALAARIALALLLVLALVWMLRRQHAQLAITWDTYAEEYGFRRDRRATPPSWVEDLAIAGAIEVAPTSRRMCDGLLGRDALVDCDDGDYRPHPSFVFIEPYIMRCIKLGIAPGDTTYVQLGAPGDELLVFLEPHDHEPRGRELRWSSGGRFATLSGRRVDMHLRPAEAAAMLQIENLGPQVELVCIGAARFQ